MENLISDFKPDIVQNVSPRRIRCAPKKLGQPTQCNVEGFLLFEQLMWCRIAVAIRSRQFSPSLPIFCKKSQLIWLVVFHFLQSRWWWLWWANPMKTSYMFYLFNLLPNNFGGDGDDIYIMMQCLCVTKNEHFPLLSWAPEARSEPPARPCLP